LNREAHTNGFHEPQDFRLVHTKFARSHHAFLEQCTQFLDRGTSTTGDGVELLHRGVRLAHAVTHNVDPVGHHCCAVRQAHQLHCDNPGTKGAHIPVEEHERPVGAPGRSSNPVDAIRQLMRATSRTFRIRGEPVHLWKRHDIRKDRRETSGPIAHVVGRDKVSLHRADGPEFPDHIIQLSLSLTEFIDCIPSNVGAHFTASSTKVLPNLHEASVGFRDGSAQPGGTGTRSGKRSPQGLNLLKGATELGSRRDVTKGRTKLVQFAFGPI